MMRVLVLPILIDLLLYSVNRNYPDLDPDNILKQDQVVIITSCVAHHSLKSQHQWQSQLLLRPGNQPMQQFLQGCPDG